LRKLSAGYGGAIPAEEHAMTLRTILASLAAGLALAACAQADEPAKKLAGARCAADDAPAVACTMSDDVDAAGTPAMQFVIGERRVRFTGKSQTGWWSGQLDGQPAMGYEVNRGHIVFSTLDLKANLEWWSEGSGGH
jgi:hypothetical protein